MFISQFALFAATRLGWAGQAFGPKQVAVAFFVAGAINILSSFS